MCRFCREKINLLISVAPLCSRQQRMLFFCWQQAIGLVLTGVTLQSFRPPALAEVTCHCDCDCSAAARYEGIALLGLGLGVGLLLPSLFGRVREVVRRRVLGVAPSLLPPSPERRRLSSVARPVG